MEASNRHLSLLDRQKIRFLSQIKEGMVADYMGELKLVNELDPGPEPEEGWRKHLEAKAAELVRGLPVEYREEAKAMYLDAWEHDLREAHRLWGIVRQWLNDTWETLVSVKGRGRDDLVSVFTSGPEAKRHPDTGTRPPSAPPVPQEAVEQPRERRPLLGLR